MAAPTSYFHKLNIKQMEIIARRRQQSGAHAYYTQIFDINKVQMKIGFPGILSVHTVFTAVYEYTIPFDQKAVGYYAIHLAKLPYPPSSSISITGAYQIDYTWNGKNEYTKNNTFDGNTIKGLHVIEFTLEASSIVIFVDGRQILEKGHVVGREKDLHTYLGWKSGNEPFAVWEAHFTASNLVDQLNLAYGFPHIDFKLQAWSYVEFSGYWKNKAEIKEGSHVLAELKTTGKALLKLNVYPTQSTASNKFDKAGPVKVINKTEIDLGTLTCSPPSQLYNITVVVGDYGK